MKWLVQSLGQVWAQQKSRWSELNRQAAREHPLLGANFIGPLVDQCAGEGDFLAARDGEPGSRGMLMLHRTGPRWRSFMPGQAQIAPALLESAQALDGLWPALGPLAFSLDLLAQDCEHSALPRQPLNARHVITRHAVTLNVLVQGDFAAYWRQRSKSLQSDIRSKFNRLRTDGMALAMKVHESPDSLRDALVRYAQLESRSWKGDQGTALQVGDRQSAFYADVLERFSRSASASIFELYIGDQLAASEMVVRGGGMAVLLKTTHDASLARYAPGYLLDYLLLEHEFKQGRVRVVEFYTQANEQKLRWGTASRDINHHCLYGWGWARLAVAAPKRARTAFA